MKMTAKIALFSAAIVTMGSLAACQSTTQPEKPEHAMMQNGEHDGHHRMKHRELTPEQKAAWEQRRAERQARFEQVQKACDGKANGQTVSVQFGDKTVEGTCSLRFEPKRPAAPAQAS